MSATRGAEGRPVPAIIQRAGPGRRGAWVLLTGLAYTISLAPRLLPLAPVFGAQQPSVFRGVVVADSPLGVRVISVEESSQAHQADLRPEDIIIRVHEAEVQSIDEFAVLSNALRGRAVSTPVLIFRNGKPRELVLHLYSYPILAAWSIRVIPDHDVRFAEPRVGLRYWVQLARGFERAEKPAGALDAYLNGLHNVPGETAVALKVSALYTQVSRLHLADGELVVGIAKLRKALTILERLFDYPLTDDHLRVVRGQLHEILAALRAARADTR